MTASISTTNLDTIPEDILYHITQFIWRNDLLALLRVRRSLHNLLLPLVYRTLKFPEISNATRDQIIKRLLQNEELASAVLSLSLEPEFDSKVRLGVDSPTALVLKACRNLKELELASPIRGIPASSLESCTNHLRLDRLTLLSTGDRSVDIYSTLLREQQSLTRLIVDYRIHPSENHPLMIGPDDLPKLHSISGGGAVLEVIHEGRKIANVNIVVGGHKGHYYPSLPNFTHVRFSERPSGASPLPSIRRLRIDDPNHSHLIGPTLELLFPRLEMLEALEVVCGMLSSQFEEVRYGFYRMHKV